MSLHLPVLAKEVLEFSKGTGRPVKRYFDGTFGRGGHAKLVDAEFKNLEIVAFDQDLEAVEHANREWQASIAKGTFKILHRNYSEFTDDLGLFDLMLLDLGVSSPQLDQPQRGFSFYDDGPLDMRMNQDQALTAQTIVNEWSEEELTEIFINLGEIRRPQRVVRAIAHDRKQTRFERTKPLADMISRVDGWRSRGHHPATQYFMALRLAVNEELSSIEKALPKLVQALEPGGRLMVITFHSLEDRMVKLAFKSFGEFGGPVNKKVIQASREEQKINPRSRSAKLRVFERGLNL